MAHCCSSHGGSQTFRLAARALRKTHHGVIRSRLDVPVGCGLPGHFACSLLVTVFNDMRGQNHKSADTHRVPKDMKNVQKVGRGFHNPTPIYGGTPP